MRTMIKHHCRFFSLISISLSILFSAQINAFYASAEVQAMRPQGFALQSESVNFVRLAKRISLQQASQLIEKLKNNAELMADIQNFSSFTPMEQVPVLEAVFAVEVEAMGIKAPKLVIDLNYPRGAFFEFDIDSQGPGTVFINPQKTFADNPLMSLSLLIHETRHSLQLQMAQAGNGQRGMRGPMGSAYYNAFKAQNELQGQLSFSDFLTLNNEYEAFLFGNYVIHKLFQGSVDMITMGTFASQFNQQGELKIDLDQLHQQSPGGILEEFNLLQKEQARLLGL
jgi:hypothetical protein